MNDILNLVENLQIEDLYSINKEINEIVERRIKDAVKEVKIYKASENRWVFVWGAKTITCEDSKSGMNIYEGVVGKSGKILKGDLIRKWSSLGVRDIQRCFRLGRLN